MNGRKNSLVILGVIVSVSLISSAVSVMLASCHFSRLRFDLLNGICKEMAEQEPEAKKIIAAALKEYMDGNADKTAEADILEVVSKGLHVQALMAVELCRLWEEQHRGRKKVISAGKKNLARLRETHQRISQQVTGLYESFALGEISKAEYLTAKTAAVKQRDETAVQISELEAALDNMSADGSLQNGFVSTFKKYLDVEEITSEIMADVLQEVRIFPDGRIETVWNYRDELEKLILDLQGGQQDGETKSLDLLQGRTS